MDTHTCRGVQCMNGGGSIDANKLDAALKSVDTGPLRGQRDPGEKISQLI